ncbi:large ribosomal subunit protein mL41-like [Halichondria panicea]|uniref:large ribosomal subunit protein mL41-like n=1 Tax=Halichondria panicea TaxID=6063 RepID=UPI00312B5524
MLISGIFRGVVAGATRGVMTSKRGNKNFYKGRGAKGTGRHTRKGGFIINRSRIPEIVVPNLEGFKLKPYVSLKTPYIIGKPMTAEDILDVVRPLVTDTELSTNT